MADDDDAMTSAELEALADGESPLPPPVLEVEIALEGGNWAAHLGDHEQFVRNILETTAAAEGMDGEVSVLLTDDARVQVLNRDWRQQDKPTNVLSFPSPPHLEWALGDIALAFETVEREAREQGKTLPNHTAHLLVHGFLHLLGYDHMDDAEAEKMEDRERVILKSLNIADPYANDV